MYNYDFMEGILRLSYKESSSSVISNLSIKSYKANLNSYLLLYLLL